MNTIPLPPPESAEPWVLICTYHSSAEWHAAATLLEHGGIPARMPDEPTSDGTFDLLVLHTEAELARELLSSPS
jgi:hypothetical protein